MSKITLARLENELDLSEVLARQALAILTGKAEPEECKSAAKWLRQCYHRPREDELKLCALNEILEGHGVEAEFENGDMEPYLQFINMGDTYAATLLIYNGKWELSDIGTILESREECEAY